MIATPPRSLMSCLACAVPAPRKSIAGAAALAIAAPTATADFVWVVVTMCPFAWLRPRLGRTRR